MGDRDEGQHDQSVGKLKEAIGDAAGNKELEAEGRIDQAEGRVKEGLADAEHDVERAVDAAEDKLGR